MHTYHGLNIQPHFPQNGNEENQNIEKKHRRKKRRVTRKTKHIIRALKSAAYSWVVQIDDAAVSVIWPLTKSYSNSFSAVDCLHSTSIRSGEFATFNTKTLSYRGPLFSQKCAFQRSLQNDASRYSLRRITCNFWVKKRNF